LTQAIARREVRDHPLHDEEAVSQRVQAVSTRLIPRRELLFGHHRITGPDG
jgi:hypothetical protein